MIYNETLNDYKKICNSCTIYIVLSIFVFLIIIGISSVYFYFCWYLEKYNTDANISINTETSIQ